jgi:hypothetical protein
VSIPIAVEDPFFTPLRSLNDEVDLLPESRMERVSDPDRADPLLGQLPCVSCS